ncbi:SNF2-related protein [Paludisphaera mucosa]|uniref:SNF2-related protein n=1 Tax=Paludisphaera mucosa TaxID=3030827 RepID=A0ABT6FH03_9BACT|nr:SNF2-related protein [Paludisphaera mucosa]MDG3006871.1 SNF2-related protein [Paludisphaera mucosa]
MSSIVALLEKAREVLENRDLVEIDRELEALESLRAQVGRKGGAIPADLLAGQIMSVVPADEWPVRADALDALLRRLDSARKEELRIKSKPAGGRVVGLYGTGRKGPNVRPYHTLIRSVDPIDGRCDCPDFLKNSLGVCKHVLAVLEHVHAKPKLVARALKERAETPRSEGLAWDPIRPLTGPGDWLDRVVYENTAKLSKYAQGKADVRYLFQEAGDGKGVLRYAFRDAPQQRLNLVETLLKVVPAGPDSPRYDPALLAVLTREKARLDRVVRDAVWPSELKTAFKVLSRPLYPYQKEGVTRFLQTTRMLLADDMGLGKTAQAIACCTILMRLGRIKRGLIIAPASLKPQWAREWAQFSELPVRILDGSPAEREAIYAETAQGFLIINYEQLLRDLDLAKGWAPDLVVLDEAQRIKNWQTKTALSVKGLDPRYRLVLTGTPMENRVEELASVVEWVDDDALEPKWRLPSIHAIRGDGRKELLGVRNLETLRERLAPCMLRRVRSEVLDQLPPRTDVRVPVEMTEAQAEEHDALNAPIARLLSIAAKRGLKQPEFLRLMSLMTAQRIISNGLAQLQFEEVWPSIRGRKPDPALIQSLSAPKLIELRQLVRQLVLDQGRKVVVFSQWRRMLHLAHWAVGDILAEAGLRAGYFTGAENTKRRTQNIVEFHDDPAFRILFATDAGGVGLNLQKAANSVVNLELPWNPAVLEQRIGRIYRLGQESPIDVYNLVSEQGIESRIADLVGSKQAFFKGLFDGSSDAVHFDQSGSFLSRAQKLYEDAVADDARGGDGVEVEAFDPSDLEVADDAPDPFDELVEPGDDALAGDGPEPTAEAVVEPRRAAPPLDEGEVRRLFSQLRIRRGDAGGVVIEAPAEAASTLGALFEGMAAMLRAAADESP